MGQKAFQNEGFSDTSCLKSCTCGGKLLCLSSPGVVCFSLKFVFVCVCWLVVVHCILCEPVSVVTCTHTPTHIHTHTHTHTHSLVLSLHKHTHTYMYMHMRTCMRTRMNTYACTYTHMHAWTHTHIHTYACMHMHIVLPHTHLAHIAFNMCVHMYLHTYT